MGSSASLCCKSIAWRAHPVWVAFQKVAWPPTPPIHLADTAPAIRISYGGGSSRIARQPRGFRQPARYAPRGYASLPTSCDPVCEHRLVSSLIRITRDSACQWTSAITYGPTNRLQGRPPAFIPRSLRSRFTMNGRVTILYGYTDSSRTSRNLYDGSTIDAICSRVASASLGIMALLMPGFMLR